VLLLNEFFYPDNLGGTGTATTDIVSRLRDTHGCEVDVVTSRFAYRDAGLTYGATENWKGTKIYRVKSPNWSREKTSKRFLGNLLFAWASTLKAMTLPKPDVCLVTTAPLTLPIAARILKSWRGVPFAYLIYDLDPDRTVALHVKPAESREVKLLRGWQTKWLRSADRVVAIGRCMKDYLANTYGIAPDKIAVVEVGADPNTVQRLESKETEFKKKHGLSGFLVIYSGNFGQYHDFDTILDAAEKLKNVKPDLTFVLTGGGHKKAYVEEEVAKRNLTNVRTFAFVPEEEFSDMLASADLTIVTLEPGMEGLCVPSKFYSFIASGRPVLALMRNDTEVARTVDENDIGLRIEIGDVDGLVAALLNADPEVSDQQGVRARAVFDKLYTADRVAEKMYHCLWQCVKGERRKFMPSTASNSTAPESPARETIGV
jgi:glycosyltransferase involved in cell wall biosynthesis